MKKILLLALILNPLISFGQNDLKVSPDSVSIYQKSKQLNRQIGVLDSIYNLKFTRKFKADSISFAEKRKAKNKGNSEQLAPVFLTFKKTFEYGHHQKKGFFARLFGKNTRVMGYLTEDWQQAVFFKDTLPGKKLKITRLFLRVWSHKKDSLARVQIHLYPVDVGHKKIGFDLLDNRIVKLKASRHQLLNLDISEKEIHLPNGGLLLSVENLTPKRRINIEFKFNRTGRGSNSYFLNFKNNSKRGMIYYDHIPLDRFRDYNRMFGMQVQVVGNN